MDELFFALEHIYRMTFIPIRCFDASGTIVLFNRGYKKHEDPFVQGNYIQKFLSLINEKQHPVIEFEDTVFAYGGLKDKLDCSIVLGPVALMKITPEVISRYAEQHNIPQEGFVVAESGMLAMGSAIAMLHLLRRGQAIHGNTLFSQDNNVERVTYETDTYISTNKEANVSHHGFDYEKAFFDYIRKGDVEGMKSRDMSKQAINKVGRMAKKPLKHFEYMMCSAITLATRAAMEGGLTPDSAYAFSDLYLQRLEQCKDIESMFVLYREMSINLVQQVNQSQKKRSSSSYTEKCKLYIDQHFNTPLTLDGIAEAINVSKSYLSHLFTQQEKMSPMAYARKKRIEVAANMLKYSDESISTIANYLCFRNQSHFSQTFKEIMGMTPRMYREAQHTIELRK